MQCRVRITGSYKGNAFEYIDPEGFAGSQFLWPDGDPSIFWWTEGSMSCDCNRSMFLPKEWHVGEECGNDICIDLIEPIDCNGPSLELNESATKQRSQ